MFDAYFDAYFCCCRFLATGNSYKSLAFSYGVAPSTVGKIVQEVCNTIWNKLVSTYMRLPQSSSDWKCIADGFEQLWNFPHCVGVLDGKHVNIKAPDLSGSL